MRFVKGEGDWRAIGPKLGFPVLQCPMEAEDRLKNKNLGNGNVTRRWVDEGKEGSCGG